MSKKNRKPGSFLSTPGYPGGRDALRDFLRDNLKYPEEALKKGIQGRVKVKFELDEQGQVSNARVAHGIGHGCDEEALRLVRMLKFKAVKNRGVRATFHKTLDIPFKLTRKTGATPKKYVYTFRPKPAEQKSDGYTIRIQVPKKNQD